MCLFIFLQWRHDLYPARHKAGPCHPTLVAFFGIARGYLLALVELNISRLGNKIVIRQFESDINSRPEPPVLSAGN